MEFSRLPEFLKLYLKKNKSKLADKFNEYNIVSANADISMLIIYDIDIISHNPRLLSKYIKLCVRLVHIEVGFMVVQNNVVTLF